MARAEARAAAKEEEEKAENPEDDPLQHMRKRDQKGLDKREVAIERYKESVRETAKDATKADNAMQAVLGDTKNKGGHDSDLDSENSDDDSGEYDDEDESELGGEGEFEKEESESSDESVEIVQPKKKSSKKK